MAVRKPLLIQQNGHHLCYMEISRLIQYHYQAFLGAVTFHQRQHHSTERENECDDDDSLVVEERKKSLVCFHVFFDLASPSILSLINHTFSSISIYCFVVLKRPFFLSFFVSKVQQKNYYVCQRQIKDQYSSITNPIHVIFIL